MHERRAVALAGVGDRVAHRVVAGEEIGAVDAEDLQTGERLDEPRDVPPGVCASTGTEIA